MHLHLQIDEVHQNFPFTAEQRSQWEIGDAEKKALEDGFHAYCATKAQDKVFLRVIFCYFDVSSCFAHTSISALLIPLF